MHTLVTQAQVVNGHGNNPVAVWQEGRPDGLGGTVWESRFATKK
jgi:hypothetical protein